MKLLAVTLSLSLFCNCGAQRSLPSSGISQPAFARDGRIAFAMNGDLWVVTSTGSESGSAAYTAGVNWLQITRGPALDHDPSWSADGAALLYASNRQGKLDLFRVDLTATGGWAPTRITDTAEDEYEPSQRSDGTIVYVRGRDADADLYLRRPDGGEELLIGPKSAPDKARRRKAFSCARAQISIVINACTSGGYAASTSITPLRIWSRDPNKIDHMRRSEST